MFSVHPIDQICGNRGLGASLARHAPALLVAGDVSARMRHRGSGLHAAAREQGMRTLYEDGLRKVVQGVTSLDEVLRVTRDQREEDELSSGAHVSVADTEFMSV